jgi:hypothetical protein
VSRIRSIKPDFWQSPKVGRVCRDARLLFIALWNEADDEARLVDSPKRLAGVAFPHDEDVTAADVRGWLDELERARLLRRYVVDDGAYIVIHGWDHQKISHPTASRLPPPPPTPEVLPKSSGVIPEPSVKPPESLRPDRDLGLDQDQDLMGGGAGGAPRPAAPEPPPQQQEAKAPEPEPKPLRSGAVPVGVLVSARRHLVGGREGFEESFANWARDPEDLIARHGERWRREYPQLDGKPPRPRLDNVVKAKWGAFKRARERDGEATAVEAVGTWLSELAAKHAWGFERDGSAHSTIVDDPVRRRALREWDRLRQSGGDVGAFDPWFAKNRERFERGEPPPTAKPDDDVMDPAEVAKILAGAVKRPVSSGRVIRGERAPAAGGTEVSGATTETAGSHERLRHRRHRAPRRARRRGESSRPRRRAGGHRGVPSQLGEGDRVLVWPPGRPLR